MVSANISWRWVFAIGVIYQGLVTIAILLFGEETCVSHLPFFLDTNSSPPHSLYDRKLSPNVPKTGVTGKKFKFESLVGITGVKLRKHRMSLFDSFMQPVLVFLRPNMLLMSIYIA